MRVLPVLLAHAVLLVVAALVIAWFAGSSAIYTLGFDPGIALGSIPAGLLLPLAIVWEGDRAVGLADATTAAPPAPGPPASRAEIPAPPGTTGPADPLDTFAGGP